MFLLVLFVLFCLGSAGFSIGLLFYLQAAPRRRAVALQETARQPCHLCGLPRGLDSQELEQYEEQWCHRHCVNVIRTQRIEGRR
jgi:hypothetical protein